MVAVGKLRAATVAVVPGTSEMSSTMQSPLEPCWTVAQSASENRDVALMHSWDVSATPPLD